MTLLVKELFLTGALQVAEPERPFWYTSGTFGPFYINTHYLFGGAEAAQSLLKQIEVELESMPTFYEHIQALIQEQLLHNEIYACIMELTLQQLERDFDLATIDLISGGERRDFFFSLPLAEKLQKPHLSLRKDGAAYLHTSSNAEKWGGKSAKEGKYSCVSQPELKGKNILHVADIVTLASSWLERWLPAVEECNGSIHYGFAILDRCQGGLSRLAAAGVEAVVLQNTDSDFFSAAVEAGMLSQAQADQVVAFLRDPAAYEKELLAAQPEFLLEEIAAGGRNGERARLYLERMA